MILQGVDSSSIVRPLLVDSSGRPVVSGFPHSVYNVLGGTRVFASGLANNAQVTVYTVPANSTLYLVYAFLNNNNQGAAAQGATWQLYTAGAVLVAQFTQSTLVGAVNSAPFSFPVPIPCTAGETLRVFSPQVNQFVTLAIYGYLL